MNTADCLRIVAKLEAAYRQSWPIETQSVYIERLRDLDFDVAMEAIDEAIGERAWPPTVAEVLTYAEAVVAERRAQEERNLSVAGALGPVKTDGVDKWIEECDKLLSGDRLHPHYRPYVEAKRKAFVKQKEAGVVEITPDVVREMLAEISGTLGGDRRERDRARGRV